MKWFSIALLFLAGCNFLNEIPGPGPSPEPLPGPVEPKPASEDAYWEEIAKYVESGAISNTDTLVLTCEQRLKKRGVLSDLSRIDGFRAKRLDITDANRAEIASVLRGK